MPLGHTAAHRGKRVLVILRDGTRLVDRFEERNDRQVRLRKHGWIDKEDLRSLSIYRESSDRAAGTGRRKT